MTAGADDVTIRPCSTCGGQGCEEGCGTCEWANAGPESHKVCRSCGGGGIERDVIDGYKTEANGYR